MQANHKPNDSKELAKELLARTGSMEEARQPWESIWEQVSDYAGPEFKGFTTKNAHPHSPLDSIVDSTARRAAAVFSAGMQSGASSPSQRWFMLQLQDKEARDNPAAKAWVQQVEDGFYRDLSRFGYYAQQHVCYHQTGLFGWQCLYLDEGVLQGLRFRSIPLHQVYIDESATGEVDTTHRKLELTARQAAQFFGKENLPEGITKLLDKKSTDKITFVHQVFPAGDRKPVGGQRGSGLPFVSYYVCEGEEQVISEGGFREMPYIITRAYRLPGTPYSYSPGTQALSDTKMLNEMKALILEAGQMAMAPPYLVPDDGFVGRFSFEPRALNYYRKDKQGGGSPSDFMPMEVGGDPRFSWELLNATKQDINEAFFVDLFMSIRRRVQEGTTPTAREVMELSEERMFLLGPMLVNQQRENFQRLFERVFSLRMEQGMLPPAPREMAGQELEVEYTSPLVLAQKESQTQAVLRTYQETGIIAQAAGPEVFDNFSHDKNVRRIMEQRGFPQEGMASESDVAQIRQARAQAQQREQEAAEAAELAKAMPAMGKRPEDGSPAQRMMEGEGS